MKNIIAALYVITILFACKSAPKEVKVETTKEFRGLQANAVLQLTDTTQLNTIDSAAITFATGNQGYNLVFWKNRAIIYGNTKTIEILANAFGNIPNLKVEKQTDVLYNYNRTWCDSVETEGNWKNYILSANLVSDVAKQQQYIDAHNTQREKWPDVGNGFCNANFQQLQIFKIGSQLVLIIRIPEANTLEELDPKTLENNPKMVEWNNQMKDYQTGIPGTKPGETWVFFK